MSSLRLQLTLLLFFVLTSTTLAHGDENHGDVETGSLDSITRLELNTNSDMMMMTPYFHWMADADALYFKAWVPRTPSGLVGACVGLFFLAILERFLGGAKGLLEAWWRRRQASSATRALVIPDNASSHSHTKSIESGLNYYMGTSPVPLIPAFEPKQDLARGGLQALQSLIGYFLMLSVMTYNAAFLISVVSGLGVGEVIFARLGRSGAHPGCVAARQG